MCVYSHTRKQSHTYMKACFIEIPKEITFLKIYIQYSVAASQNHLFILTAKESEGSCNLSFSALASW